MNIVILDRATLGFDINVDVFSKFGNLTSYDSSKSIEVKERIKNASIVLTNKAQIRKNDIDDSSVKLICVTGTGTDNVDIEYAKEKNITVKNVAGYSTSSVSQVAFSMILYFVQKLNYYKNYVDEGNWQKSNIPIHIGTPFFELDNKKVGIIGFGEIGRALAKRVKAFNCDVVYYSTSGKNNNSEYKQISLDELLKTCDIISIHAPLNEYSKNLLKYENMKDMKDGVILLNLGRGGIINESDLAKLIDEKEIYCGIDVVSKEPIEEDNALLKVKNKDRLLLTPHIAWSSIEARKRLINMTVNNIEEFLKD